MEGTSGDGVIKDDLELTLELVHHLARFSTEIYPDAGFLSRLPIADLKFWSRYAGAFCSAFKALRKVPTVGDDVILRIDELVQMVISSLSPSTACQDEWIVQALSTSLTIVDGICCEASVSLKDSLREKGPTTHCFTQIHYEIAKRICTALSFLIEAGFPSGDWSFEPTYQRLKQLFADIADAGLARLNASMDVERLVSMEVIEDLEKDMNAVSGVKLLVPAIASYAMSLFSAHFSAILGVLADIVRIRLPELIYAPDQTKITILKGIVARRLKLLKLIEANAQSLYTHHVFHFIGTQHIGCSVVRMLKKMDCVRIKSNSADGFDVFCTRRLADDPVLRKTFLEENVERADLFSDDFFIANPGPNCSEYESIEWEEIEADHPFKDILAVKGELHVSSRCFSVFRLWIENRQLWIDSLLDGGFEPIVHGISKGEQACFIESHTGAMLQFIEETLDLIEKVPPKQFAVKELSEVWDSCMALWDQCVDFLNIMKLVIPINFTHFQQKIMQSALCLLKVSCLNIRMSYLEPFTWASQILDRLTRKMQLYGIESVVSMVERTHLVKMYNEFSMKWGNIEKAAVALWDDCRVFKREITAIQVAAFKLQRALFLAKSILPDIEHVPNYPENFLHNAFKAHDLSILAYCSEKNLKPVAPLKRKQYLETFCCFNPVTQSFLTIKEIKMIKNSRQVVAETRFVEKIEELKKLTHPNLSKYYFIEFFGDSMYIGVEYCERHSLNSLVHDSGHVRDELLLKRICRDILTALVFLRSRGLSHGDIAPGNVVQDFKGHFKLIDYGQANSRLKNGLAKVDIGFLSGTAPYMSPEAVHNKIKDPYSSDIWSFGCLLIHLITGCRPWHELEHDYAIIYRLGATKFLPEALLDLPISSDGAEFIKSCLVHEPELRPTAMDLLRSDYLALDHCRLQKHEHQL